jgi:hypothetical protein
LDLFGGVAGDALWGLKFRFKEKAGLYSNANIYLRGLSLQIYKISENLPFPAHGTLLCLPDYLTFLVSPVPCWLCV